MLSWFNVLKWKETGIYFSEFILVELSSTSQFIPLLRRHIFPKEIKILFLARRKKGCILCLPRVYLSVASYIVPKRLKQFRFKMFCVKSDSIESVLSYDLKKHISCLKIISSYPAEDFNFNYLSKREATISFRIYEQLAEHFKGVRSFPSACCS